MKAVNVRKERTILACFSALDPGLAGSCLARVGVDPAAALAEADPDTVCHALGQLVANRDNVTLSTLLPCLSLRPEMPLRRFAPWTAPGRSGDAAVYKGKGGSVAR